MQDTFSAKIMAALLNPETASEKGRAAARARDAVLTKPPGALGRLEELALWWRGWRDAPLDAPQWIIFAGEHGVARRGVSAFPAEVTAQMVANFDAGGAAANQIADALGARLSVRPIRIGEPTADFTVEPAMTEDAFEEALAIGWEAVDPTAELLILGEMGIGNTTAAAAVAAARFGGGGADWAGRGTGVDERGLSAKIAVIEDGLRAHRRAFDQPLEILRRLGGRELAAIAAAIAAARAHRIPVMLDGFICCAAAAPLTALSADALDHCRVGHASAEQGHRKMLSAMGMQPILDLGLRLGEGSGAGIAALALKAALACHFGMATFAEAGVSEG